MKTVKLSPAIQKKIIAAIRIGKTVSMAAHSVGIPSVILYNWIRKGEKESSGPYRKFNNAVMRAVIKLERQFFRALKSWLRKK